MGVWGTFLLTSMLHWFIVFLYTIIDVTGKPSILLRYKVQDNTQYPVPVGQILKVVPQVLVNQILVGIPYFILAYYLMVWRGYDSCITLPTFQQVLVDLIICILVDEAAFYNFHRLLHQPPLFKYIHKRHHEWTSPIAIATFYCHPIEYIFSILTPPMLGPLILGSHLATSWIWYTIAVVTTINAHSGFHFPFFQSPEAHDFHHLKLKENFGLLGIFDRLHGTDSIYRSSKMYQRDIMLLSLVPAKQLYPDDPKKE